MQIEYTEDESRVRWERNGVWHEADLDELIEAWERMPTIEPKRGKWEDVEEDEWICFRCSECGHDAYSYTGEILSNEWKFCPYCGAKMEGSEE